MLKIQNERVPLFEMLDPRKLGLPEVPVLGMYRFRGAQPELAPHRHLGRIEICYLAEGQQVYHVGGRDFVLKRGDFFISMPDEVHGTGGHPQGRAMLHWLNIDLARRPLLGMAPSATSTLVKRLLALKKRHFRAPARTQVVFDDLQRLVRARPDATGRLLMRLRVLDLLAAVVEAGEATGASAGTPGMNPVLQHIDAHMDEALPVQALARVAGLSMPWFQARFRREMGMPPADYVMRRKVAKAQELLKTGQRVTTVAFNLGFSSSQYFATVFRRYTGKAPRDLKSGDAHP